MAIAFDATAQAGQGAVGTTLTYSHTCTGSNRILFVSAGTIGSLVNVTGITYNGVALTNIGFQTTGALVTTLWYLVAPATGANNIVITLLSSNPVTGQSSSFTGASQTGVPDASGTGGPTATTSYSQSLTSIADNCFAVISGIVGNGLTITPGTNTTKDEQENAQLGSFLMHTTAAVTPAGTVTLAGTSSSQTWSSIMATFAPVGAAPAVFHTSLRLLGVGK